MKNFFKHFLTLFVVSFILPSCLVTTHVVGSGGTYDGKNPRHYDIKKKKWYLFAGIPLDDVQPHTVARNAQNYTVRETLSFGDLILSSLTFGVAQPRTIRVSWSEEEK